MCPLGKTPGGSPSGNSGGVHEMMAFGAAQLPIKLNTPVCCSCFLQYYNIQGLICARQALPQPGKLFPALGSPGENL